MQTYKTPGVYVEELSKLPPSVAGVATAIPAFIGITETCPEGKENVPVKIISLLDFESKFGGAKALSVSKEGNLEGTQFVLYDSIRLFYDNGGGTCYVASVAQYGNAKEAAAPEKKSETVAKAAPKITTETFTACLNNVAKVDEITMVLAPDAATCLDATSLGNVQKALLNHCETLGDRVAILDVKCSGDIDADMEAFRNNSGINGLSYGAAYYPYLLTGYTKDIDFQELYKLADVKALFTGEADEIAKLQKATAKEEIDYLTKKMKAKAGYAAIEKKVLAQAAAVPPSGAIAGIYCASDARKGVWQAPANMSVSSVNDVAVRISDEEQASINVDANSGKSVNAIRPFQGKGILVWGARTLDGFSNEWRYIPVRRLFNYIEESVQKATAWAVFQPNNANTWINVRCQIENFLSNLWRDGALAGATPEQAFYVNVGLNSTMDANDILEGRMIVEIGLAAVRPAEFIILQFSHKLQES